MPSTPFIGVRISWLMFARKSPFARFAASAASLASSRRPFSSASWRARFSERWRRRQSVAVAPRSSREVLPIAISR